MAAIKSQISKLSKEIENTDIDFKEDSAPFKNFIIWGKESMNLTNNLENILAKIDTTILREQEKQRVSAKEGSLESYISKK